MKKVLDIDSNHVRALNYLAFTYAEHNLNLEEAEDLVAVEFETKATSSLGLSGNVTGMIVRIDSCLSGYTKVLNLAGLIDTVYLSNGDSGSFSMMYPGGSSMVKGSVAMLMVGSTSLSPCF